MWTTVVLFVLGSVIVNCQGYYNDYNDDYDDYNEANRYFDKRVVLRLKQFKNKGYTLEDICGNFCRIRRKNIYVGNCDRRWKKWRGICVTCRKYVCRSSSITK